MVLSGGKVKFEGVAHHWLEWWSSRRITGADC